MKMATATTCSSPGCFIGSSSSLLPAAVSPQKLNRRGLSLPGRIREHRAAKPSIKFGTRKFCPKATALISNVEGAAMAARIPASVPVRVAHELLQAGHRYLDVRTPEEFSAGHALGAINIPYMYRVGSGMSTNPSFVKEVSVYFRKDDEIIIGCQSGKRSLMAAKDLLSAGFYGVVDIAGGYSAWARNRLPTDS